VGGGSIRGVLAVSSFLLYLNPSSHFFISALWSFGVVWLIEDALTRKDCRWLEHYPCDGCPNQ
jgi:hypothetical protein